MYICSIGDKTIETSPRSWRTSAKNFHESLAVVFIKLFITHDIDIFTSIMFVAKYFSRYVLVLAGVYVVIQDTGKSSLCARFVGVRYNSQKTRCFASGLGDTVGIHRRLGMMSLLRSNCRQSAALCARMTAVLYSVFSQALRKWLDIPLMSSFHCR